MKPMRVRQCALLAGAVNLVPDAARISCKHSLCTASFRAKSLRAMRPHSLAPTPPLRRILHDPGIRNGGITGAEKGIKTNMRVHTASFRGKPRLNTQYSTSFTENTTSSDSVMPSHNVNTAFTRQDSENISGIDSYGQETLNEQESSPMNRNQEEESDKSSDSEFEETSESEADMGDEAKKHTPLTYQIAPEVLSAALEAPPKTSASYWSQKLYRGPNNEKISTHYCENFEVAERVAKYFVDEKTLGFDIEWKPHPIPTFIKQNASLIQIASEGRIALFHIALFKGSTPNQLVPPTLKKVLESPDILKVGVAIKADFTRLEKFLNIKARCVMELSRTHNLIEAENPSRASHKLVSLATQVQQHLLLPLYKGEPLADDVEPEDELEWTAWKKRQRVRESDWSKRLDVHQIQYAAADAYAGLRLYDVLELKRKQLKPIPPAPRLCDDDPPRAPISTLSKKRAMAAKILKDEQAKAIAEALTRLPAEEPAEEDTQEYETAPENVELEKESEESEESASETSAGTEDDDSDTNYIPGNAKVELLQSSKSTESAPGAPARRVGRLNLSKLKSADPEYPVLNLSSDGESESDAFEPLPEARPVQRDIMKAASPPPPEEIEEDEFADPELEEALMNMDIDNISSYVPAPKLQTDSTRDENKSTPESIQAPELQADNTQDENNSAPTPHTEPLIQDTPSRPPEYDQATAWAKDYLDSTIPLPSQTLDQQEPSRIRATIPHLRAYHLWHYQNVPVKHIGTLLKSPPLPENTVASHIMQAVSLEGLEVEKQRLRALLEGLGERGNARWSSLWTKVK